MVSRTCTTHVKQTASKPLWPTNELITTSSIENRYIRRIIFRKDGGKRKLEIRMKTERRWVIRRKMGVQKDWEKSSSGVGKV